MGLNASLSDIETQAACACVSTSNAVLGMFLCSKEAGVSAVLVFVIIRGIRLYGVAKLLNLIGVVCVLKQPIECVRHSI